MITDGKSFYSTRLVTTTHAHMALNANWFVVKQMEMKSIVQHLCLKWLFEMFFLDNNYLVNNLLLNVTAVNHTEDSQIIFKKPIYNTRVKSITTPLCMSENIIIYKYSKHIFSTNKIVELLLLSIGSFETRRIC